MRDFVCNFCGGYNEIHGNVRDNIELNYVYTLCLEIRCM